MNEIFRPTDALGRGVDVLIAMGRALALGDVDVAAPARGMESRCLHRTSLFPPVGGGRSLSEVRGGTISHHAAVFRRGGNLLPLHRQGSQRTERWEALSPEPRK